MAATLCRFRILDPSFIRKNPLTRNFHKAQFFHYMDYIWEKKKKKEIIIIIILVVPLSVHQLNNNEIVS